MRPYRPGFWYIFFLLQQQYYFSVTATVLFFCYSNIIIFLLQQQYYFVYEALQEALLSGETTTLNSAFPETYEELCARHPGSSKTALEEQFDVSFTTGHW